MVKLKGKMPMGRGPKPRPLFPPGELPLFGPPPAFMRRPPGPPPRPRGPPPMGFGPPPGPPLPPMRPPPLLGPPMGPPGPPMRRRPGPMPLLQRPVMPPRPPPPLPPHGHFLRGPPRGKLPLGGPPGPRGRIDKNDKNFRRIRANKRANKRNKMKKQNSSSEKKVEPAKPQEAPGGPWVTDEIKKEIEKMTELKKVADEKKEPAAVEEYNKQKEKVDSLTTTAKIEYEKSQNAQTNDKTSPVPTNEDEDFFCETCDIVCDTEEELEVHLSEHVMCNVDGCTFSGGPDSLSAHIKYQHNESNKSAKNDNIEKWIAERKRRYPTEHRVALNNAEKAEMELRGEVMTIPKNRPFQRTVRHPRPYRGMPRSDACQDFVLVDGPPPESVIDESGEIDKNDSSDGEETKETEAFSDDEWKEPVEAESQPQVCRVLSALCSAYNSESEDEKTEPPVKLDKRKMAPVESDKVEAKDSDDEPPVVQKIERTADAVPNAHVEPKPPRPKRARLSSKPEKKSTKPPPKKRVLPRPSTLLQKLLSNEIKHERNLVLQCIRFITLNNYFDKDL